jgi:superfamily II DNA or RNA helicase
MLIPLRGYQENARQRARELVSSGIDRVVLVSPMGSGKTILAAAIIFGSVQYGNRVLFVADQRELIRQCFCKLVRAGIPPHDIGIIMANTPSGGSGSLFSALDPQLSDRDIWRMFGRTRPGAPVQIASIDTYKNRAKPHADLVIVDECHEGISKSHMAMFANYPNAIFIGLTATPYRSDGRGLGEFWRHLEVVTTTSALMATGDLVDPTVWTVPLDRLPDLASVKLKSNGDFDEDDLAVAMDKPELVGDIVDHWYRRANGIRTVAFATGVQHSKDITAKFRGAGIRAEHLDAMTPTEARDAILQRLETGETHIVVNCGILCLDEQTEILTSTGWVGIDEMTYEHRVANWDDGWITFEAPKQIIRRPRLVGERMVSSAKPHGSFDFRVTEGHELVVRTNPDCPWRKLPAGDLVGRQKQVPACGISEPFDIEVPRAATSAKRRSLLITKIKYNVKTYEGYSDDEAKIEAVRRVDRKLFLRHKSPYELSEDDCRLIGFWLGDGCAARLQTGGVTYIFSQSEANHRIINWFDSLLSRLGVHFLRKIRTDIKGTPHDAVVWHLPRGTGSGSQERRGLYYLEPYLKKQGTELFWGLNKDQFAALIDGFWMADGNHGDGSMTDGMSLSLHNTSKELLDILQAVAVCRGYSTSITLGQNHLKAAHFKKLYKLTLMQRGHRTFAGSTLRFETEDKDERVWCVTVRTGNIITRRNGRAIAMGNCKGWDQPSVKCAILARPTKSKALHRQQMGRILRPYNCEPAIILDHSGNVRWLGRPEDEGEMTLEARKKARKGTAAPSCKTCECLAVIPSACRICPMCGHEFSATASERTGPEEREGELVQIPRSISAGPDLRAQWDALVERWQRENRSRNVPRKPGWIAKEFKQRTGATQIPAGCALPALTDEQQAKLERFGELNRYAHAQGWSPARLHAVFANQEKPS